MSYVVGDSIRGRRIQLVYAAAQLPLAASVGRMEKSREVRRHLARSKTRYAFVVRDPADNIETWWSAEDRGISFAAAIDQWVSRRLSGGAAAQDKAAAQDTPGPAHAPGSELLPETPAGQTVEDCLVVIPLDGRVYAAEVAQGLVSQEWVLRPGRIADHLAQYPGAIVHGFSAGDCTDELAQRVELEELPFDLREFRYRSPAREFAAHGMIHPHVGALALTAVLCAGAAYTGSGHLQRAAGLVSDWLGTTPVTDVITQEPRQIVAPKAPHTAAADLRALVRLIRAAEPLLGQGLVSLAFAERTAVFSGEIRKDYPALARRIAGSLGGTWSLDSAGWRIVLAVPPGGPSNRVPGETEPVVERMLTHPLGPQLVRGPDIHPVRRQAGNISVLGLTESEFAAAPESVTAHDLLEGARLLEGLPVSLAAADCSFLKHRLDTCTLTFRAQTLTRNET